MNKAKEHTTVNVWSSTWLSQRDLYSSSVKVKLAVMNLRQEWLSGELISFNPVDYLAIKKFKSPGYRFKVCVI